MSTGEGLGRDRFAACLAFAHELADLSAAAIRPHFRAGGTVDNKAGDALYDPVTAADREAEQVIREALAARFPDHGLHGEEYGLTHPDAPLRWVVDPIDGTRAFIMGLPLWGTLIGLAAAGVPVLGMMNQPFTGERFWSEADSAHYRGPDGARTLRTRACSSLSAAVLSCTSPDMFAAGEERERFEAVSARARMRRFGGDCYAYCLLAAGHIDAVVEAGLHPYDVVALVPIIERAGGVITGWDGGDPCRGGRVIAAGDARTHRDAIAILGG